MTGGGLPTEENPALAFCHTAAERAALGQEGLARRMEELRHYDRCCGRDTDYRGEYDLAHHSADYGAPVAARRVAELCELAQDTTAAAPYWRYAASLGDETARLYVELILNEDAPPYNAKGNDKKVTTTSTPITLQPTDGKHQRTIAELLNSLHVQHPGAWLPLNHIANRTSERSKYSSLQAAATVLINTGRIESIRVAFDTQRRLLLRAPNHDNTAQIAEIAAASRTSSNFTPVTFLHDNREYLVYKLKGR